MARVLLLILLFWIFYLLGKRFFRFLNQKSPQEKPSSSERMVKCALCEAYIPENESMQQNQKTVCKNQPCKN